MTHDSLRLMMSDRRTFYNHVATSAFWTAVGGLGFQERRPDGVWRLTRGLRNMPWGPISE
jgi:hypothetical protein